MMYWILMRRYFVRARPTSRSTFLTRRSGGPWPMPTTSLRTGGKSDTPQAPSTATAFGSFSHWGASILRLQRSATKSSFSGATTEGRSRTFERLLLVFLTLLKGGTAISTLPILQRDDPKSARARVVSADT